MYRHYFKKKTYVQILTVVNKQYVLQIIKKTQQISSTPLYYTWSVWETNCHGTIVTNFVRVSVYIKPEKKRDVFRTFYSSKVFLSFCNVKRCLMNRMRRVLKNDKKNSCSNLQVMKNLVDTLNSIFFVVQVHFDIY